MAAIAGMVLDNEDIQELQAAAQIEAGNVWCDSCSEWRPAEKMNSEGVCLSCVTGEIDAATEAQVYGHPADFQSDLEDV